MDKKITVRKANREDAKSVWQIRNSPLVRKTSGMTKKINFPSHQVWFENKYFKKSNNYCFILEKNKEVLGYCRLDSNKNKFIVSIAVDPVGHGSGLGSILLSRSLSSVKTNQEFLAEIKHENQPSIKLFLKNNFEIYRQDKKVFYLRYNNNQDSLKKEIIALYYFLERQPLEKSGAIVWLHGDRYDRARKVLELYKNGWAPEIVIAGNNVLTGIGPRLGENNVLVQAMAGWLSRHRVSRQNVVINENSFNTKDQAVNIIRLSKKNQWKKITLVASSYHQPRAFLTFLRQAQKQGWQGKIINQPANIAWHKIPSGRTKYVWQCFDEEMEKIKLYRRDLAGVEQGIKQLLK